jgi:histidinol-phosphate phosphatase family protein
MSVPAVFLDKDGTLIEDLPHNADPGRIRFAPGALEGLKRLHAHGFMLLVVTNQAGVALGLFQESALRRVERRLQTLVADAGVALAGMYWCPHHPAGSVGRYAIECGCRKPQPGLLRRAARELDIDLERSWMVGDILDDVEAGRRAGCRTVLLDNGNETEWRIAPLRLPHLLMPTLARAAEAIVASTQALAAERSERARA